MIENLRKYTGLIIVVFVILFISFFFLDTRSVRNAGGGQAVMKIAGRTYNEKEFRSLGQNSLDLVGALASSGDFDLYQFMPFNAAMSAGEDGAAKFFITRMILRDAKEKFGVFPADEEITAYIRGMRVFNGPDGKFKIDTYRGFIENYMGRLGLTERDLRTLASDIIASKKIGAIIGSGLTVDKDVITANLAMEKQQITGEVARMDIAPFEEKIQPTEDEIKKYWESIEDSFTTEPKRKFTYIIVSPKAVEEAKVENEPETIADAAASDEVKKAAAKKKEEALAKRGAEKAEARRKNQMETDSLVDDFISSLADQKGSGFEDLAKANAWEVKTTELFPLSAPPKELDLSLRASSSAAKVADKLFQIHETSDAASKISDAIPVGENQWIVARLDGEEKSRTKTFDEARAEARAQYIAEKAAETLKTAAEEAVSKIKPLLAAGKSFTEAAKEAGVTEIKEFSSITSTYRPDGATEPQGLFAAASSLDPGAVGEVIIESDRAFILHVTKREVVKDANATATIDQEIAMRTRENETRAFMSWIAEQTEDAKVEELYKR